MSLAVVGLSHRTAPVEVRERFVFGEPETHDALVTITGGGGAKEAVLLSTCNRTELYLHEGSEAEALKLLAARASMPESDTARFLYTYRGRASVEHLFRVVSSLDSLVLGEAQIQGQVRTAYERAAALTGERPVVGPVLSRLLQTALGVGGKVRSNTALGQGAASVSSAAVELAKKIFGTLRGRRALVLGAGDMAELALQCFASEGIESAVVVSRTEERARELAERVGCHATSYEDMVSLLPETDIIATATSAPHYVLTRELLERSMPGGPRNPLLIVDIALPRDVEPSAGKLANVFLYDIDDLHQIVADTLERRRAEVVEAEKILQDGVEDFWSWYAAQDVVPLIRALRDQAEEVRQMEVEKALRKLAHLAPADREAVEALTRQLLNKVLHRPTVRLREAASNGQGVEVVEAARYLFELDPTDEFNAGSPGGK